MVDVKEFHKDLLEEVKVLRRWRAKVRRRHLSALYLTI